MTLNQSLPKVLLRTRLKRGLSQRQLAEKMKCPRTFISKLEHGRTSPTLGSLIRIGEALDTPAWKLLGWAQRMVTPIGKLEVEVEVEVKSKGELIA